MITFFAAMILGAMPTGSEAVVVTEAQPKMEVAAVAVPSLEIPTFERSELKAPKIEVPKEAETGNLQQEAKIQRIILEGKRLEQGCRWRSALEHYEKAFRMMPTSEILQSHYTRLRVVNDILKRCSLDSYVETVARMNDFQTLVLARNYLQIFTAKYVRQVTFGEIFDREVRCMEIALGNSSFCERILPDFRKSEVEAFRRKMREFAQSCVIQNQADLEEAMMEIGRRFEKEFGRKASFLVLEGLFGFVVTLDCHSEVLLNNQYQDLLTSVSGQMVGVGIEFSIENGLTLVTGLVPNSPAWRTDLQKKDVILEIDGMSIRNWSLEQVAEKMEGREGERIWLTVQTGQESPRNVLLTRESLAFSSVEHSMILPNSGNVGYIRLTSFQRNSRKDLNRALLQLQAQGMTKLILDLRGNPGGPVQSAIDVSNMFLNDGVVLQEANSERKLNHYTTSATPWENLPLVVLIDERSASAAEIFAGAVQERKRGVLVGKRSFGKGTIQTILPIPGGNFVLKLTTAHFFSPTGQRYNYVGVSPDYEVRQVGKPIFETQEEALLHRNLSLERNAETEKKIDSTLQIAMQALAKH